MTDATIHCVRLRLAGHAVLYLRGRSSVRCRAKIGDIGPIRAKRLAEFPDREVRQIRVYLSRRRCKRLQEAEWIDLPIPTWLRWKARP